MIAIIGIAAFLIGFLLARFYYLHEMRIAEFRAVKGFIVFYCLQLRLRFDDLQQTVPNENEYQQMENFFTKVEIARTHDEMAAFWERAFKDAYTKALNERVLDWYII